MEHVVEIVAIVSGCLVPVIMAAVICYFWYKARKAKYQVMEMYARAGKEMPAELLDRRPADDAVQQGIKCRGLRMFFCGLGLTALFLLIVPDGWYGIGILVACIGLGLFLSGWLGGREKAKEGMDEPCACHDGEEQPAE